MKRFAFILAFVLAAAPAFGQQPEGKKGQGKWQGTSKEERQRMREDMHAYKGGDKAADKAAPRQGQQGQRQMSPEQREGLRRDMQDANRNLKKR